MSNYEQKRLYNSFQIAQIAGTWVITNGFNAGVGKHVGDALQGSCKQCIGILPWSVIKNNSFLVPSNKKQSGTQKGGTFSYDVGCWLTDNTEGKLVR